MTPRLPAESVYEHLLFVQPMAVDSIGEQRTPIYIHTNAQGSHGDVCKVKPRVRRKAKNESQPTFVKQPLVEINASRGLAYASKERLAML